MFDVLCRELGFDGYEQYWYSGTQYGDSPGPVWMRLSYPGCTGHETTIERCHHTSFGDHTSWCSYDNPAVRCRLTPLQEQYKVRLAGTGSSSSEGRVEINYQGQWGTVCGNNWGDIDATVVCKQLGFSGPSRANVGQYGRGHGVIWLDDVQCTRNDGLLAHCQHSEWNSTRNNCDHGQDAGVICTNTYGHDIRLSDGQDRFEGRVEVFYNGAWGTVCDDSWDFNDADVVCRFLGFGEAMQVYPSAHFGAGSGDILMDVDCTGSESNIFECDNAGIGVNNSGCGHAKDAGVRCRSSDTDSTYDVRLAGANATSHSEGRVEISYRGTWGTVCGDGWDDVDAAIVCKELGFTGSSLATVGEHGAGTGTIWLDDVSCSANDDSIASCHHNGWGTHNCNHSRDAGVKCSVSTVAKSQGSVNETGLHVITAFIIITFLTLLIVFLFLFAFWRKLSLVDKLRKEQELRAPTLRQMLDHDQELYEDLANPK